MTIFEMLEQSGVLTLLGVSVVFSFLIVLVFAISLMGKIIGKFVKEQPCCASNGGSANGAVIAAISAAVNEHRKNK